MFDNRMVTIDGVDQMIYSVEYKLSDLTIVGTECNWDQILMPGDIYQNCLDHDQARCIYTVRPQIAKTNEYITRRRAREFFFWLNGMASNYPKQFANIPPPPTPAPSADNDQSSESDDSDDSGYSSPKSQSSPIETTQ